MEIALIENLQREDLNPIEEGIAYQQLVETFNLTQDEVAQRLGRSRSAITNTIRLLSLPEGIKREIIAGRLTQGQARPLLSLQSETEQKEYAQKIIHEKLTARQVEKIVQDRKEKSKSDDIAKDKLELKSKNNALKDAILLEMEEKLRRLFGTKVSIKEGKAGSHEGRVEFLYYSDDDLERLLQLFLNP
jgi:ParB family chromosome partitioning protein